MMEVEDRTRAVASTGSVRAERRLQALSKRRGGGEDVSLSSQSGGAGRMETGAETGDAVLEREDGRAANSEQMSTLKTKTRKKMKTYLAPDFRRWAMLPERARPGSVAQVHCGKPCRRCLLFLRSAVPARD